MPGFTAQPDDLRSSAPAYGAVADTVQSIYVVLTEALEAEGACWGNDAAGHSFGVKYVSPALSAIQQMSETNVGLRTLIDGISSWAKNYIDVDQTVHDSAAQ